jgi:hypothetical protein
MSDRQKVLIAHYQPKQQKFRVPKGLDLEDKSKVEGYWIQWGELHVKCVDGKYKHIKPDYEFSDDEKRPCVEDIQSDSEDDEDHDSNVEDEEEDEKDEDEDEKDDEDEQDEEDEKNE